MSNKLSLIPSLQCRNEITMSGNKMSIFLKLKTLIWAFNLRTAKYSKTLYPKYFPRHPVLTISLMNISL